jgi:hypothetical protein
VRMLAMAAAHHGMTLQLHIASPGWIPVVLLDSDFLSDSETGHRFRLVRCSLSC